MIEDSNLGKNDLFLYNDNNTFVFCMMIKIYALCIVTMK